MLASVVHLLSNNRWIVACKSSDPASVASIHVSEFKLKKKCNNFPSIIVGYKCFYLEFQVVDDGRSQ